MSEVIKPTFVNGYPSMRYVSKVCEKHGLVPRYLQNVKYGGMFAFGQQKSATPEVVNAILCEFKLTGIEAAVEMPVPHQVRNGLFRIAKRKE